MMKKNKLLKLSVASALLLIAVIGASSFTSTDETASSYDTVVCTKTDGTGTSYTSACNAPAKNGPCDTKKNCPAGYN